MRLTCCVWVLLVSGAAVARAADPVPFGNDPEFVRASAAFAAGQYAEASAGLARVLERYPRHPWLQMLLADACERAGQWPAARDAYRAALANTLDERSRAIATEAADRVARTIERQATATTAPADLYSLTAEQIAAMSVVYPDLARRQTAHFDIRTNNAARADVLAGRVETIFAAVSRPILGDAQYAHRIELVVYPDRAAFLKDQPADAWSGGGFIFTPQPDGSARQVIALYQIDESNRFRTQLFFRDLPHELTHAAVKEYFGSARSVTRTTQGAIERVEGVQPACPLWLEEGLACTNEADGGASADAQMRALLSAQAEKPLAEMIDQIRPKIDVPAAFYAESTSLTRFLRSQLSNAQMKTFLAELKAGNQPSVALGRALVVAADRPEWLTALEERWHNAVAQKR
jgi:hypothetical protein